MQIELRCNTLVQDFQKYKKNYENIAEGRLYAVYMNKDTLVRFMKQLARINKWGGTALTPEEASREIMYGAEMRINGTYIRYLQNVPDNYMEF